jgi:hypothetical protein
MRLHGARISESKNIFSFITKETFLKMIHLIPERLLAPDKIILVASPSLHDHLHCFVVIPLYFEV